MGRTVSSNPCSRRYGIICNDEVMSLFKVLLEDLSHVSSLKSARRATGVPTTTIGDLDASLKSWKLWNLLAWNDLNRQYGRSLLGLLWVPLFTALFIGAFTLIFSILNGEPPNTFALYVASGYIIWIFMSESLVEGAGMFSQSRAMLLNSLIPRSLPVFRLIQRNVLRLCLNLTVLVGVFVVFFMPVNASMLLALVGLVVIVVTTFFAAFSCAILGARFEDLRLVISIGMRLLFFLTPIMWKSERMGAYQKFLIFNPFGHYIELVRAPLEGRAIPDVTLMVVAGCSILAGLVAVALFSSARPKLVHWV